MALATVTTKGQVTIPKSVRDSLKIQSGDKIEIVVTKNREAVIRPVSKSVDDVFRKLRQPERKTVMIEEMDDAVRNRIKDKY